MEVLQQVRKYIFDSFLFDAADDALNNDDSFLEKGIIDSTGVLEVVAWIEETFGFQVADEELIPENLDSVNRITAFIGRKTA